MYRPTVDVIEYLAFSLAKQTMDWDEPIPPFATRYPGKLESCIAAPFATYLGKDLYETENEKAAILFYLMIKNHPFQNGNKRIAVTTLITFLLLNSKWLKIKNSDLYDIAIMVAESAPAAKDSVVPLVAEVIGKHLGPIPPELFAAINPSSPLDSKPSN